MTSDVLAVDLPRAPVGEWFDNLVTWCTDNLGWLFDGIGTAIEASVDALTGVLTGPPPLVLALVLALLALVVSGWKLAAFSVVGFALIDSMELWKDSMDSLALVIVAAVVSTVLSVPIGIAAVRNDMVSRPSGHPGLHADDAGVRLQSRRSSLQHRLVGVSPR